MIVIVCAAENRIDCLMILNLTGYWTHIYTQNDENSSSGSSGDVLYDLQSRTVTHHALEQTVL